MRPNEAEFFPERYAKLPELGRLTGRGNTANVEVVLNAKTDLIVDVGSTGATYASLASQVQEQTRIPYGLFDGRIKATPAALRALGRLMGNEREAERLAAWYENEVAQVKQRVSKALGIRSSTTGAAGQACRPKARARSTSRCSKLGARNAAAEAPARLVAVSFEQVLRGTRT